MERRGECRACACGPPHYAHTCKLEKCAASCHAQNLAHCPGLQVYNSPSISADLLQEVSNGMGRVHALFDRHLHTFLTLLPAQSHSLDLFVARFVGVIGTQPV